MKNVVFASLLAVALVAPASGAVTNLVPPQIKNLVAAQRAGTFYVDISYDLVDPDSQKVYILVECTATGGNPYIVPIRDLTGDVGLVAPGVGKKIAWNAWNDWPGNFTTNAKVRLIADDTASAIPPPPTTPPATNLVWIPSGAFDMSGTKVWLTKGFWMGKYEVTQAEYQSVMTNNPSNWKGSNLPVEQVTWDEAVLYCQRLTARERAAGRIGANQAYRLPTEAEWEYGCRAGTTTQFSYGDDSNYVRLGFYAWYSGNAGGRTHEVGLKGPNRWGLFDMHGNVWEWCQDWYGGLPGGAVTDPQGPPSGSSRVLRGGSWDYDGSYCTSSYRGSSTPSSRFINLGFRVALVQVP
jgi:formylglycine-generating enzyme required for sulfatase activity